MPIPTPGKDNVTGGSDYVMNLGIEPDMTKVKDNLGQVNDLLDQAQAKFKAINEIVGSTTNKMTQLSRATSLFVSEAIRAKNEYQRLATLQGGGGGPSVAAAAGGGTTSAVAASMPSPSPVAQASLAGQWGGQGANMYAPNTQYGPGGGPAGGGGAGLPPLGGIPPARTGGQQGPRIPRSMQLEAIQENLERIRGGFGGALGGIPGKAVGAFNWNFAVGANSVVDKQNAQFLASQIGPQITDQVAFADKLATSPTASPEEKAFGSQMVSELSAPGAQPLSHGDLATKMVNAGMTAKMANNAFTAMKGASFGPRITGMLGGGKLAQGIGTAAGIGGRALGAAGPWLLAGTAAMYGISSANKMINSGMSTATRYTGMTGGTQVGLPFGAVGGSNSAMGIQESARQLSGEYGWGPLQLDFNAAVTKEQANQMYDAMMTAGYKTEGGMTRGALGKEKALGSQAMTFMYEQAKQGFGDMNEAMGIWINNVDEMGGSTEDLTGTMQFFRDVAKETDVGVQQLTENFKAVQQQFMAVGGGIGGKAQTAWARRATAITSNASAPSVRGTTIAPTQATMMMAAGEMGMTPGQLQAKVGFGDINAPKLQSVLAQKAKPIITSMIGGKEPKSEDELQQMMERTGAIQQQALFGIAAQFGIQADTYPKLKSQLWEFLYKDNSVASSFGVPEKALGGVVSKPTLIMAGEAGPEVITPLASSSIMQQMERARYKSPDGAGTASSSMSPMGGTQQSGGMMDVPDEYYHKLGQQFTNALDRSNRMKSARDEARRRKPTWEV